MSHIYAPAQARRESPTLPHRSIVLSPWECRVPVDRHVGFEEADQRALGIQHKGRVESLPRVPLVRRRAASNSCQRQRPDHERGGRYDTRELQHPDVILELMANRKLLSRARLDRNRQHGYRTEKHDSHPSPRHVTHRSEWISTRRGHRRETREQEAWDWRRPESNEPDRKPTHPTQPRKVRWTRTTCCRARSTRL